MLSVLCLCVLASELLAKHTPLRLLGAALIVILLGMAVANLGVIPAGSTPARPVPVYTAIFRWVAPLAIFWLLLQVDLRKILDAGLPMLVLFVGGAVGTTLGAILGLQLIGGQEALGADAGPVAGMYVGTYTGGSINFNAIALHFGVAERGVVFAGAVVVDNVLTAVWMVAALLVPKLLRKLAPDRAGSNETPTATAAASPPNGSDHRDREPLGPTRLAAVLSLGLLAVIAAEAIADALDARGLAVPSMILLTILALALAQARPILAKRLDVDPFAGSQALGMFAVYLFLAVVGAHADLAALAAIGRLGVDLTILAGTTILVHGLVVFGLALLLRFDVDAAAVASQANIGGGTTALALARGLDREDLVAPGILVGALGTAGGTFLGFWVAGLF